MFIFYEIASSKTFIRKKLTQIPDIWSYTCRYNYTNDIIKRNVCRSIAEQFSYNVRVLRILDEFLTQTIEYASSPPRNVTLRRTNRRRRVLMPAACASNWTASSHIMHATYTSSNGDSHTRAADFRGRDVFPSPWPPWSPRARGGHGGPPRVGSISPVTSPVWCRLDLRALRDQTSIWLWLKPGSRQATIPWPVKSQNILRVSKNSTFPPWWLQLLVFGLHADGKSLFLSLDTTQYVLYILTHEPILFYHTTVYNKNKTRRSSCATRK